MPLLSMMPLQSLLPRTRSAERFADVLDGRVSAGPGMQHLADLARQLSAVGTAAPVAPGAIRGQVFGPAGGDASMGVGGTVGGATPSLATGGGSTAALGAAAPAFVKLGAAVVAASLVTGGVTAAATRAMPGDPLYGAKRGLEQLRLSLATGDIARGGAELDAARARMDELKRLLDGAGPNASLTPEAAQRAVDLLVAWAAAAGPGVSDLLLHPADGAARTQLSRFGAEQSAMLTRLRPLLPDGTLQTFGADAAAFLARLGPAPTKVLPGGPDPGRSGIAPRAPATPPRPVATKPVPSRASEPGTGATSQTGVVVPVPPAAATVPGTAQGRPGVPRVGAPSTAPRVHPPSAPTLAPPTTGGGPVSGTVPGAPTRLPLPGP